MKKEYTKPAMQVVKIQQTQMLWGSPGANSLSNSIDFNWNTYGFEDSEDDY